MIKEIPRVVISATHKSSGKTVVSIGLCAALADKGLKVQPFKKGPDYIDPGWLSTAAGRECHNLDNFIMGWNGIDKLFKRHAAVADINIIEGNKGLFDSVETDGEGSTANLARHLKAPVILVVDSSRITRGIAPILIGYKTFEPDINIAGVILNKVSNTRHESKLRAVIERYCDIEILGCLSRSADMEVLERHLGLIPLKEDMGLYPTISDITKEIAESVNLQRVMEIASSAPTMEMDKIKEPSFPAPTVKIGVVRDQAFSFYYPENLEALRLAGARLVPVNALRDTRLPGDVDALYIGGGFPETLMKKLEMNESLRDDIRLAIEKGLPVHAECGGLIYLAKSVSWNGKSAKMVGALDCEVVIEKKPKGHGYMTVTATGNSPWIKGNEEIRAHEFHYGKVVNSSHSIFAFNVLRGTGIDGNNDGIVYKNVTASFAHFHHIGFPTWAEAFVSFAKKIRFSVSSHKDVMEPKRFNKNTEVNF